MTSKERRELYLWLSVFAITAIFQFWRASELDGMIFIAIIVLISFSVKRDREFASLGESELFRRWGHFYFAVIALILAASKIHTKPAMIALLASVPLLLLAREKKDSRQHPRKAVARSVIAWSLLAVGVAGWELFSYISGEISGEDFKTPTISMLVNPFIEHPVGRIAFVTIWIATGFELIFHRRGN